MKDLLQYSHDHSRTLYAAVARGVKFDELKLLLDWLRERGGVIGNAQLSDVEVRDQRYFFCAKKKLTDNTHVYEDHMAAGSLPPSHNWDCDGVWLPPGVAR